MHGNIWIRVENIETWKAIKDKSAWVNERLTTPLKEEKASKPQNSSKVLKGKACKEHGIVGCSYIHKRN